MSAASAGVQVRCLGLGRYPCTTFDGLRSKAPKRTKCAHCGGRLYTRATVWAPVEWRGDGRYERPAVTFATPETAQAACVGAQVVRHFDA